MTTTTPWHQKILTIIQKVLIRMVHLKVGLQRPVLILKKFLIILKKLPCYHRNCQKNVQAIASSSLPNTLISVSFALRPTASKSCKLPSHHQRPDACNLIFFQKIIYLPLSFSFLPLSFLTFSFQIFLHKQEKISKFLYCLQQWNLFIASLLEFLLLYEKVALTWLQNICNVFSRMSYMWSGKLIPTGDMENDLLTPTDTLAIKYLS